LLPHLTGGGQLVCDIRFPIQQMAKPDLSGQQRYYARLGYRATAARKKTATRKTCIDKPRRRVSFHYFAGFLFYSYRIIPKSFFLVKG
jgi:hypothetical protein